MWNLAAEHFKEYIGVGLIMIYYLVCLVWLFISEKEKEKRLLFVYLPLIILVIFFNPLTAYVIDRYADDDIYYRLLWMLPVTVTIAYTVTKLFIAAKGKIRAVILIVSALLLITGGRLVYTDKDYSVAENIYHMPQAVVDICDDIVIQGREIRVAFPTEMIVYVRQYTPLIVMPYGFDDVRDGGSDSLRLNIDAEEADACELFSDAYSRQCHYVVIDETHIITGNPEDYGFYEYARIDGYILYRNDNTDCPIED